MNLEARSRRVVITVCLAAVAISLLNPTVGSSAPARKSTQASTRRPKPTPTPSATDPMIAAAGDITCDPNYNYGGPSCGQDATADLLAAENLTAVLPLGDNEGTNGSLSQFQAFYEPTWGRFKSISYPVPGDHEYSRPGAAGYFSYFGARAGDPAKGYYSYDLGDWHLIALNSRCNNVGGCGPGTAQWNWLTADLAASDARCTLAYWHNPAILVNRDPSPQFDYSEWWKPLNAAGVDIVLNGDYQNYHRFVPQNAFGIPDPTGIRQWIVGTGGAALQDYADTPTTAVRSSRAFGALKLTLHPTGYDFDFLSTSHRFSDSGTGA